jgi:hypothetical protein
MASADPADSPSRGARAKLPAMADSPPPLPESRPAGPLASGAWALLALTAALGGYVGLSALLLPLLGNPGVVTGIDRWLGPATGLGQLAAVAALAHAIRRRDLPGAVRAAALVLLLGWIALLPAGPGATSGPAARWTLGALLALPVIAIAGWALARRRPLAAAWIVTLPTALGLVGVLVFAVVIAVRGF